MNDLISSVGDSLATIYGPGSVYFGTAETSAVYPYMVYTIQGSGTTEYTACSRNEASTTTTAVQISVWSESSTQSADMIEAIVAKIDTDGISMSVDNFMMATKIDEALFEDPDRDQDGKRIWQGVVIFEFMVSKGA